MYAILFDSTPETTGAIAFWFNETEPPLGAELPNLVSALHYCGAHTTADIVAEAGMIPDYMSSWDMGDNVTLYIGASDNDTLSPECALAVYTRSDRSITRRGFTVNDDLESLSPKVWRYGVLDRAEPLETSVEKYRDNHPFTSDTGAFTFAGYTHLITQGPAEH